jgi:endonuclease III
MRRAEKAERILSILDGLYPEVPIPLDHRDPFTLLVAVLLSAQTTDKKVNEVTPALFDAAPDPAALAALSEETIRGYIRQIGLAPTKARNLKKLATLLVETHDGRVPASFEALEALPGVGHKTASVVMAQAFGVPAFPVDTHIDRLAHRWGLTRASNVAGTERDLKKVFPRDRWNDVHLQIIFFGREHCPALYHDLSACPICSWAATKKRIREEAEANAARRKRPGRGRKARASRGGGRSQPS